MEDNFIKELESAAQIILAMPEYVSPEQRHSAEVVFNNFRKMKNPYGLCREILEKSRMDFVLFQTAVVLKNALIVDWAYIPAEDRINLRQYLFNFITRKDIPAFVRGKLMQVIAIMIKRAGIEDGGMERSWILDEAQKMINSSELDQQIISTSILTVILEEYSITNKSNDTGLTFDEHFKAKKMFELNDLKRVFVMILQSIEGILKVYDVSNEAHVTLMDHFIGIIEIILTWGFISPKIPRKLIGAFESIYKVEQEASLRLSRQWESVILDPKVLEIFFQLYWKIRENEKLQPKGLTCLVQLSTLCGPVLSNPEDKLKYALNYLTNVVNLFSNTYFKYEEIIGFAMICRKWLFFNSPQELKCIPKEHLDSFIHQMFLLTKRYCELAHEITHKDDTVNMDGFCNMLEAWVLVIQAKEHFTLELLQQYMIQMFDLYLKCHLLPPEGIRQPESNLEFEITDDDVNDRIKFKEQLIIIGMFGREFPGHSLPVLCKIFEDKIRKLYSEFQNMFAEQNRHPSNMNLTISKNLEQLYEDIHWLILISAYVVANEIDGERSLIPPEIMNYSIHQYKNGVTDLEISLKLLASPSQCISEIPEAENKSDLIIRLVSAIFRYSEIEKSVIDAKMGHFLSPQVSSTLVWFLKVWSDTYLLMMPTFYNEISEPLQQAFGKNTPGGIWTMNYLLNKICRNINFFGSEYDVVDESIELFMTLAKRPEKSSIIFQSEYFKTIVQLKDQELPSQCKISLIKALVSISALPEEVRADYLQEILKPIAMKYCSITSQPNLSSIYQDENIKLSVISVLEEIKAAFSGTHFCSLKFVILNFRDILKEMHKLLELYHNYIDIVELILQLLCEAVQHVYYSDESNMLNEPCLNVIHVYVKYNANRISADKGAEEDSLQDLLLLMKLMKYLLAKDLIDVSASNENDVKPADIVVYGLTNLLPLITMDLLKYPELCIQFYKTLTFFVETESHTLCSLEPDLLKKMLYSVELGLTSFGGPDIESLCFDFLYVMGNAIHSDQNPDSFMYAATLPFLKILLDLILAHQLCSENKSSCGRALFSLMCVYREQYVQIVQTIIQSQKNQMDAERLSKEFTNLTHDINLINSRPIQIKFMNRFDKFLSNIGFVY